MRKTFFFLMAYAMAIISCTKESSDANVDDNPQDVSVSVTGIAMDMTSLNLSVGDTATVTATILPDNATDKEVTWSSSNESIVTVSDGQIIALRAGKTTITATTHDGNLAATCDVSVVQFLTFSSALGAGNISLENKSGNSPYLEYSYDKSTWTQWNYSALEFSDSNPVYIRGKNETGFSSSGGKLSSFKFDGGAFVKCSGNIMSLISYETEIMTIPCESCFYQLFLDCQNLVSAPELPATTLAKGCYFAMFCGCTHLTSAPELPAITLAENCYRGMFSGCTSLTSAPELPAITLANSCYYSMFATCTYLTSAPELPATTLANSCYYRMFYRCDRLTSAPELPATTLANSCYCSMFLGCTSLTSAPELPAITLAENCYNAMFNICQSLASAPELPATTLAKNCYLGMFASCTHLTSAPELPATTLANFCYYHMFKGCIRLTSAPELPAITLAENCYGGMFGGCTSLNSIKMMATDISAEECLQSWTYGVAKSGTFVKNASATWDVTGESGVPNGWTIIKK